MRPTIPFDDWRIAVDHDATRAIARVEGPAAYDCSCVWCRNWAVVMADVFPTIVQEQLRRLGIDPARPTDLYPFAEPPRLAYRVTYHCVGKILSGPAAWRTDERLGTVRCYRVLRAVPELRLSIVYHEDVDPRPDWATEAMIPLIQVDFRLDVPWSLAEPEPHVFGPTGQPKPRS